MARDSAFSVMIVTWESWHSLIPLHVIRWCFLSCPPLVWPVQSNTCHQLNLGFGCESPLSRSSSSADLSTCRRCASHCSFQRLVDIWNNHQPRPPPSLAPILPSGRILGLNLLRLRPAHLPPLSTLQVCSCDHVVPNQTLLVYTGFPDQNGPTKETNFPLQPPNPPT